MTASATVLLATEGGASSFSFEPTAAAGAAALAWFVLLLPLAGFVVLLFAGRRLGHRSGWLATATVGASFALSVAILAQLLGRASEARALLVEGYTWISVGALQLSTDLLVDPLSATMLLVVTGVGGLVHLYSVGYMHGDRREPRYFAYLNLFIFSMLLLVLAADYVVLFVGWELVGLCSYLLIGHWFEARPNAVAAKKAMIVNRIGDVSFAVGLFLIFAEFGSLAYGAVLPAASDLVGGGAVATAIALLLLGGAVGKSAQIPLYVWLPDAMAGPTPVSALIHAATMVTAGVYMIARSSPLYVQSEVALEVVATVGVATALLAALIAVQQDDIKKVLAYSTVSQLGYMFVGVGVGAFGAGMFHLVTHAFFKGLLFLAAGSVMHALADRTDLMRMGGLRSALPVTFWTSVVAVLAISGVPPLSGFFSKDQILAAAYEEGHTVIWLVGLLTVAVTAFYMSRWLFLIFFGPRRFDEREVHPHESPPTMTVPLVALAGLSAVGWVINPTHGGPLDRFLGTAVAPVATSAEGGGLGEAALIVLSAVAAAVGIGLAVVAYARGPDRDPLIEGLGGLATGMRRAFWVDRAYEAVFVTVGGGFARFLVWFDRTVIDGAVNGVATLTGGAAQGLRRTQTGYVRSYVAAVLIGAVALVGAFLVGGS